MRSGVTSTRTRGYSLAHVDSYGDGTMVRYAAIWALGTSPQVTYEEKTFAEHNTLLGKLTSQGWTPKVVTVAVVFGDPQVTALYTKEPAGSVVAMPGLTSAEYQTYFTQQKEAGRKLRYVNAYRGDGKNLFSAIWTSEPQGGSLAANHGLSSDGLTEKWQKNLSAGFRTKSVTGYEVNGQHTFAAFWTT